MFWKKKKKPKKTSREAVLEQAKASMAAKRAEIGEEALDQIKHAIMKRESSALEGAKRAILAADEDKVRDNLTHWLRE